ncbi:MAG TPA: hypothetical protein VFJ85_11955 [Acidimicrobiales bacterium]|nr:hypothetical protein [Acidimicrobiales bacterium]
MAFIDGLRSPQQGNGMYDDSDWFEANQQANRMLAESMKKVHNIGPECREKWKRWYSQNTLPSNWTPSS